ncbi:hypothetical protein B0H13DRAFT_2333945 [Mycena leptocephala]|nr:hypothetical protein B0H13DRAFT_2333945 [Mycena leptocephala]
MPGRRCLYHAADEWTALEVRAMPGLVYWLYTTLGCVYARFIVPVAGAKRDAQRSSAPKDAHIPLKRYDGCSARDCCARTYRARAHSSPHWPLLLLILRRPLYETALIAECWAMGLLRSNPHSEYAAIHASLYWF